MWGRKGLLALKIQELFAGRYSQSLTEISLDEAVTALSSTWTTHPKYPKCPKLLQALRDDHVGLSSITPANQGVTIGMVG